MYTEHDYRRCHFRPIHEAPCSLCSIAGPSRFGGGEQRTCVLKYLGPQEVSEARTSGVIDLQTPETTRMLAAFFKTPPALFPYEVIPLIRSPRYGGLLLRQFRYKARADCAPNLLRDHGFILHSAVTRQCAQVFQQERNGFDRQNVTMMQRTFFVTLALGTTGLASTALARSCKPGFHYCGLSLLDLSTVNCHCPQNETILWRWR